jgi:hypothetical protein
MLRRPASALAIAVGLALALVPPASAQEPATQQPPSLTDDFSAADQYVESVPTSRGPKVPGVGKRTKQKAAPLSTGAKAALAPLPAKTAKKLEQIATSPELGAPEERLEHKRSTTRVPAATVRATEVGDEDNLTWLVLALVALTGLALSSAAYRRYQARKSIG